MVFRGHCHVDGGRREESSYRTSGGGNLAPAGERLGSEFAMGAAGDQVALKIEVIIDGSMGGEEPLRRAGDRNLRLCRFLCRVG
jgi:hypothetical protein